MEFNKYRDRGDYHWQEYKQRLPYGKHVDKLVEWIGKDSELLDIGAGDGLIVSMFPNAFGIDNDKYALAISKEKGVNVIFGDAYNLPKDKKYENVLMGDVIEHLEFVDDGIEEIKKVIKPKGFLYITTPPARPDGNVCDPYHYVEYSPASLEALLAKHNFTLCEPIEIVIEYNRMYGKFINDN